MWVIEAERPVAETAPRGLAMCQMLSEKLGRLGQSGADARRPSPVVTTARDKN